MEKADVVIVGSGIAGLAAAFTLCEESSLAVVLVEERAVGANRTTPIVFPDTLDAFGLGESIQQNYSRYEFHSPLGATASFDYKRDALTSIDYRKACASLYERAAGNGLQLRKARALDWSPSNPDPRLPLVVHLDNGDSIQTQVLIDASGHAQWAAKRLNIRLSPYYSVCYGEFLTGCSVKEHSSFWFLAPHSRYGSGGGWFYPLGESSVSMGYAILVKEPHHSAEDAAEGYRTAKREFQPFADWVKDGFVQRVECGVIPVGRIGRFVDNRILIVGDAAGQATPWCMMGVNQCLSNGLLSAKVTLKAFANRRFDRAMLSLYERNWAKGNRESFWRALCFIESMWMRQTDEDWDKLVSSCRRVSAEKKLQEMRYNQVPFYQRAYAVVGYLRRQLTRRIGNPIGG